MATFKANTTTVSDVRQHPNADSLDLITVEGFQCVTGRGQYRVGDPVVYIPSAALLPGHIVETLGLTGRLAGPDGNRVKPAKLRGELSEGLVYPLRVDYDPADATGTPVYVLEQTGLPPVQVSLGQDVTELLGITKYEPEVPAGMDGDLVPVLGYTHSYDIENVQRYRDVLTDLINEGQEFVLTEKIHGTFMQTSLLTDQDMLDLGIDFGFLVSSKGIGSKGFAFDLNSERNQTQNVYVRAARHVNLFAKMREYFGNQNVTVFGEVYGTGVQDLAYGASVSNNIGFRVFDIYIGKPGKGAYVGYGELVYLTRELGLEMVPVLYVGELTETVLNAYTNGNETVSGKALHMREGVVITPVTERTDQRLQQTMRGRVKLKSVSADYHDRKKGTEYN